MRVPQFDESLRTGHPLIDEQHEWLFKLAARVAQMMGPLESGEPAGIGVGVGMASGEETNSPQVQNAASEAVFGLLDYATEHFSDEEALMRESHYPLANMHASLHEDLNLRLAPFVLSEVNGEVIAADRIVEFFVDWLTTHILEHDRQFTTWLAANPPEPPVT